MKVLVVFANPRGTSALSLGEEDKTIQECVRRSKHRDNVHLSIKHAVTVDDVRRALLDDVSILFTFQDTGQAQDLPLKTVRGDCTFSHAMLSQVFLQNSPHPFSVPS